MLLAIDRIHLRLRLAMAIVTLTISALPPKADISRIESTFRHLGIDVRANEILE
jgi:hypothetical protein